MSDNRFRIGHYEDAIQYTKDILSSSSSIDEIALKANIIEESKTDIDEKDKNL